MWSRVASEYRDTVRAAVHGDGAQPDEATLDALAESEDGERFLQRSIAEQGQGRGEVLGVGAEIQQDRHGAVAELQQLFNDMAVLSVVANNKAAALPNSSVNSCTLFFWRVRAPAMEFGRCCCSTKCRGRR
jgi:hypothetical protein